MEAGLWDSTDMEPVGGFDSDLTSPYDEYFALAAATYQVPEALLKAMGKAESDFNPNAVSSAGAMGIMRLCLERRESGSDVPI